MDSSKLQQQDPFASLQQHQKVCSLAPPILHGHRKKVFIPPLVESIPSCFPVHKTQCFSLKTEILCAGYKCQKSEGSFIAHITLRYLHL